MESFYKLLLSIQFISEHELLYFYFTVIQTVHSETSHSVRNKGATSKRVTSKAVTNKSVTSKGVTSHSVTSHSVRWSVLYNGTHCSVHCNRK